MNYSIIWFCKLLLAKFAEGENGCLGKFITFLWLLVKQMTESGGKNKSATGVHAYSVNEGQ